MTCGLAKKNSKMTVKIACGVTMNNCIQRDVRALTKPARLACVCHDLPDIRQIVKQLHCCHPLQNPSNKLSQVGGFKGREPGKATRGDCEMSLSSRAFRT